MKIFIARHEADRVGGGWTFQSNFAKGMAGHITSNYDEADTFFICSPSMIQRDEVIKAKADGKKIVLRIDNAVRNSRNRNTGMSRMFDMAQMADVIVFQSQWAREYLSPFIKKDGVVILNGVDLDVFKPGEAPDGDFIFYSRFNRDETKNWEVARYWFSQYALEHRSKLYIAGQFSPDLREANFDFYNGESFQYLGVLSQENLANVYRMCKKFLYTYFNDACSNSLIEALVSGCEIVGDNYYQTTGGAFEIIRDFSAYGRDYFSIERMCNQYKEVLC